MASNHPYYSRRKPPAKQEQNYLGTGLLLDLSAAHLDEASTNRLADAQLLFYDRAAAAIRASTALQGSGDDGPPQIFPALVWRVLNDGQLPLQWDAGPEPWFRGQDLLEMKWYRDYQAPFLIASAKCLALLAYADYFPQQTRLNNGMKEMVSRAILAASPGWCGTNGPGVDGATSLGKTEGNYDMTEMSLLPLAYGYYDDLSTDARELLINELLQRGRIHRPNEDDTFTSGRNPNDWGRAGHVSPVGYEVDIGETENHIMMIVTARYLTNQLLFQRTGGIEHDNRRNQSDDSPSCFSLLMTLLRQMVRGDFSEYNAKNYQSETRWALVNLCTYAYDHEIRLGARLVLDYRAAHLAVSSNDLRRMVPFRRRWNDTNMAYTDEGFMKVGLLSQNGGDPMSPYLAMQAGNIRIYEYSSPSGISDVNYATDMMPEVLSDYRIPPIVQDLFVNDLHRRFYQRLHRTVRDEVHGGRNADNMEIYAGSPSYLISAGGAPAPYAIDPGPATIFSPSSQDQQLGAAVTTSFIPTGTNLTNALDLIQFGAASRLSDHTPDFVENYGVAPDFACGHQIYLPSWLNGNNVEGAGDGVHKDPHSSGFSFLHQRHQFREAGLCLAIYQQNPGGFSCLEACDTWLHPEVSFHDFKRGVLDRNANLLLQNDVPARYVTHNGNQIEFVIWQNAGGHSSVTGAQINSITFSGNDAFDSFGRADLMGNGLLNGTVMNTVAEAKIEVTNHALSSTLTLDFSDEHHPARFDSFTGEFEVAGFNNEVWLDFDFQGMSEGDVCRPFSRVSTATAAVADGGTIALFPGKPRSAE